MATKKKTAKTADPRALSLGTEKLKSSGLTLEDAEILGMHCLGQPQTQVLHPAFKPLCSIKIEYHGPDGFPIIDHPGSTPFYRLRFLETPSDFGSLTDKKPPRYVQEPNTAPVATKTGPRLSVTSTSPSSSLKAS
jgi:hypothetical protein